MRRALLLAVALIAAGVAVASILILLLAIQPPDAETAVLGGLWVSSPFLLTIGLAVALRRWKGVLVALLVALGLAAGPGLYLYGRVATETAAARQDVATAVQPGEDPNSGPAAMRKSGADAGLFIVGAISLIILAVVPPAQLVVVAIATVAGYVASRSSNPDR